MSLPRKWGSSDPRAYALALPLRPLLCRRTVFWGFVWGLMNLEFFCTETWLQKPPGKSHVWWASLWCGVEGDFMRYGPLSSGAGWWIWPVYTPYEIFSHSLKKKKRRWPCALFGEKATIVRLCLYVYIKNNLKNANYAKFLRKPRQWDVLLLLKHSVQESWGSPGKEQEQNWRWLGGVRSEKDFNAPRAQELSGSQLWP